MCIVIYMTTATITSTSNRGDWTIGTLNLDGQVAEFQAKVYDEPSEYGINDGRISKLWVRSHGVVLYNYDRGLDVDNLPARCVEAIVEAIEAI
jgi:hypothetical protein